MGGYFTHHLACDRTDKKAAAPHSGGTIASLGGCKTGHVPIIIFHERPRYAFRRCGPPRYGKTPDLVGMGGSP
jgi:hypothetical protein